MLLSALRAAAISILVIPCNLTWYREALVKPLLSLKITAANTHARPAKV